MHLRRLALVALLGLMAGCGDDETTGPGGIVSGSFFFNFAGGISGTYTASGSFPTGAGLYTTSWAAGEVVTADGETFIAAVAPGSASTHNFVTLFAERITPGSVSIALPCSPTCGDFGFLFGVPNTGATAPTQTCFLTTGTINFSTLSSTRAVGTVSGSGDCSSATGAMTAFTVTGGTFDVPMVTGLP